MGTPLSLGLFLFDSKAEQATMFLALGLSLSLFGLTIIEATPTSAQSLFSNQGTLSFAYWISLWLLSIHTVLIVPSLVGASAAMSFGHYLCCTSSSTKSDRKKYPLFDWRKLPWWIRFAWSLGFGFVFVVFKNIFYNGLSCCFAGRQRQNSVDSSVLPLRDESMIRSPSGEIHDDPSLALSPKTNQHQYSPNQYISRRLRLFVVLGGTCGIVSVLGILSTIGPLIVQPPKENETTILSLIVSWICAVGLLISSILNGFGSVSLPYTTLSGLFLQQVRPDYIIKLEAELRSIHETLAKKRTMLKELKVEIPTLNPSRASNRSSLTGSSNNTFSMPSLLKQNSFNGFSELGDELKNRRQILQTEIGFMEDLVRETTFDLEELKYTQMTAAAARTSIGKTKSYVGIVFSLILLVRLFNAGFSICRSYGTLLNTDYALHHHKKSHSDIVTTTLLWLTGHNYFSYNQYNTISQMVSLVLSAVLSFTQVRTFLRTATVVHRRLSGFYKTCFCGSDTTNGMGSFSKTNHSDQKQSVNILWPVISGFLGCYSLACIVLIKMMLPERFSVAFSMALNETGIFTIHSSIVNTVFFSSAVLSTAIFGMLLGIQRQNILNHAVLLSQRGSNDMSAALPDV